MKHFILLLAMMMGFINLTNDAKPPSIICSSLAYHSPYHETVKDAHGITAEMLKLRYLC